MRQNNSPETLLSWQSWMAKFGPRFLLFARNQTRSEEDAADVLQETLVELWRRNGGAPPDPPLVFATLRRRAIDLARANHSRITREKRWMGESSPEGCTWFESKPHSEEHRIATALRAIRPEFAEVVVLKIWGELTFEQVAQTLAINASTAASRYRYGLEALRACLACLNPTEVS